MDVVTHENLINALNNNDPNEPNRNDPYVRLCTSERLNKDVETLMNSSFWINALKTSKAIGIGSQLHCNLRLPFMKTNLIINFIVFFLLTKIFFFSVNNIILSVF